MQMLLTHAKEVKKGKELEKICERERDILAQQEYARRLEV